MVRRYNIVSGIDLGYIMQAFFLGLAKSLMTEWLFKRLAYLALKALASSTKNDLDDEGTFIVGQALGLEDKEDEYETE